MKNKINNILWQWLAMGWLCIEVGLFIESHTALGQSELFWAWWFSITVNVLLTTGIIELQTN
jgi:hypothetical protein